MVLRGGIQALYVSGTSLADEFHSSRLHLEFLKRAYFFSGSFVLGYTSVYLCSCSQTFGESVLNVSKCILLTHFKDGICITGKMFVHFCFFIDNWECF